MAYEGKMQVVCYIINALYSDREMYFDKQEVKYAKQMCIVKIHYGAGRFKKDVIISDG